MTNRINLSARRGRSTMQLLRAAVFAAPVVLAGVSVAQGGTAYWDIDGATPGSGGAAPAGNWTGANWSADSTGSSATTTWLAGDNAIFAAGADATGTYTVTVSGTQSVGNVSFEEGTVTLSGGTLTLGGAPSTFTNAAGGTNSVRKSITLNSALDGTAGARFDLAGVGVTTFNLGGSSSALTGQIVIARGNGLVSGLPSDYIELVPTSNTALGASGAANLINFSTTGAVNNYSRVRLTGGRNINKDIIIRGGGDANGANGYGNLQNSGGTNTWSGNILAASGSVGSNGTGATIASTSGTLVVTGVIQNGTDGVNNGYWTKTGNGTLALENTNTFTNFIRHQGGTLEIRANGALGTAGTPGEVTANTIVTGHESGATPVVAFRAPASAPGGFSYTTYELIDVAGARGAATPVLPGCGIDNFGGANTFAGDIRFGQLQAVNTGIGNILGAQTGTSLELSGKIWAAQDATARIITKTGGGELIITGANTAANGPGVGRPCFGLDAGTFVVSAGQLTMRGAGGALSGGMNFEVRAGATMSLDSAAAANSDRISDAGTIALSEAAEVKLLGNTGAAVAETAGALTIVNGFSTVTVGQPGGSTSALNLAGYTRSGQRPTVLLRGIDGSTSTLGIGGAVTLKGGGGASGTPAIDILPEAVGDASVTGPGSDFVTVQSAQARPLTASEYTTLTSGLTDIVNTTVAAASTISADTSVNSLKITGGNTLTIDSSKFLHLRSGALLGVGAGTSNINGGTLKFENSTIITDSETGITSLEGASEEGIITVPSGSTLAVSSTITGGLGITKSGGGVLTLTGTNLYGNASGYTTINAGVLEISQDVNLGDASAKVVLSGGMLRALTTHSTSRNIELNSTLSNSISVSTGAAYTVNGVVSGGRLTKVGAGDLVLGAANSYTGGTSIQAGQVSINNSNQLGTGSVALDGGALHPDSGTYTNLVSVNNSAGGFRVDPGDTVIWNAVISGSAGVRFDGGGVFNPIANNTYSGDNLVSNGSILQYTASIGLGDITSLQPDHFNLNNGTLRVTGQATGGIASFSTNRGITLGAGGGTIDTQQGTAAATYVLTFPQVITGAGNLTVNTDANSITVLSAANTYTGSTNIPTGHTRLSNNLTSSSAVNVTGGKLELASGGGSNRVIKTPAVSVTGAGKIDLKDNKLITASAIGTHNGTNYTGITGLVETGRNGGVWDGPGITTSMSDATGGSGYTVLGVATAMEARGLGAPTDTDVWGGQTVTGSDTLVMYTYGGDANLSGFVDVDDYGLIDFNAALGGVLTGWYNGDFDYNGFQDVDDYGIIDFTAIVQGAPFPAAGGAGGGMSIAAVPEPASMTIFALAGAGLLRRRRRTH